MADAHWRAIVFYGDNPFHLDRQRRRDFSEEEEAEAKDWLETCRENDYIFTVNEIEYVFPYYTVHHTRLQFFEETVEED